MSQLYSNVHGNYNIVLQYFAGGLSVIPLHADGSKAAIFYNWRKPRPSQLVKGCFSSMSTPRGIGILIGPHSGNLEVLDFDMYADTVFPIFEKKTTGIIEKLVIVRTPSGGYHVYFRCETNDVIGTTGKLAMLKRKSTWNGKTGKTIIEIPPQVVAPGSHPATHATGKPYEIIQGDLCAVPRITPAERETLLSVARMFDQRPKISPCQQTEPVSGQGDICHEGTRPGDIFAARTTWEEILEPHDWQHAGSNSSGDTTYWRRPDKWKGTSATTTGNCLYVFSTSDNTFESGTPYTKFAAHALLNHKGDYRAAAAHLSDLGSVSQAEIEQVNQLFN